MIYRGLIDPGAIARTKTRTKGKVNEEITDVETPQRWFVTDVSNEVIFLGFAKPLHQSRKKAMPRPPPVHLPQTLESRTELNGSR